MTWEIREGDCVELLKDVSADSVSLVVTSPPYADQRKDTYGGVHPDKYVEWWLPISEQLKRVLTLDGTLIVNTANPKSNSIKRLRLEPGQELWTVDASEIAMSLLRRNLPNTPILGAFVKSVPVMDFDTMSRALEELMSETFPRPIVEANLKALQLGHDHALQVEVTANV